MKAPSLARFGQWCVLAGGLALVLVGCSSRPSADYSKLRLVQARGTVRLDGNPLPNAVVIFEDVADATEAVGLTDAAGRYVLQIDSRKKGVTVGKKLVRISTATRIPGLNVGFDGEAGDEGGEGAPPVKIRELVPDRYNQNSELFVEVTPQREVYDFDLSGR